MAAPLRQIIQFDQLVEQQQETQAQQTTGEPDLTSVVRGRNFMRNLQAQQQSNKKTQGQPPYGFPEHAP